MRVPIRGAAEGPSAPADSASLQLHPVPSKQALIVKVVPPKVPPIDIEHVPCDIVLIIDVSTSMYDAAPVPGEAESTGLSVLDLTKHAALTIIETLNDQDRLGIVTFGTRSTIVQGLTFMNGDAKDVARGRIKDLQPNGSTNLWYGLRDGIQVFNEASKSKNVPAMMLLTDGMPNHMCPQQGYIPKLRTMPPLPAAIHTFGFGYGLRSGLLKSLAEYGHGNYAFIPDAGMIGTVFVHAVANLQTTFATNAMLTLTYPKTMALDEISEDSVVKSAPAPVGSDQMELQIPLGSLQFGQSRDIFMRVKEITNGIDAMETIESPDVTATISYKRSKGTVKRAAEGDDENTVATTERSILDASEISAAEVAYHESRAEICRILSSLFPLGPDSEHRTNFADDVRDKILASLTEDLPAKEYQDERNMSLMQDICGPEPQGQISIAIKDTSYMWKWGVHYLPSYYTAHSRQICNSFKDPGPLQYGIDSPLFIACRDRLNDAFDNLPPPEPSLTTYSRYSSSHSTSYTPVSMSRYRDVNGVCFAGSTPVELASGRMIHIRRLRRGMKVRTPTGIRKVAMVLRTPVQEATLCRVGALLVTPWHPISLDGKSWDFPAFLADGTVRYTGSVYSVMLQRDGNLRSHAMRVAGTWGVTLGHGLTTGTDARAHHFFGDYNRVGKSLVQLGVDKFGIVEGRGVDRDASSGLVCGFRAPCDGSLESSYSGGGRGLSPRGIVLRMAHVGGADSP